MRQSTIHHINERIAHANQQHGRFHNFQHVMKCAINELNEAGIADCHLASRIETVKELLDAAVVCIRGAEQFGGLEGTEYDPAVVAFKPAVEPTDEQVEALAKALEEAHTRCEFTLHQPGDPMRAAARAAYAHIGAEVAKLKAELAILHPGETVEGVVGDRDSCLLREERLKEDLVAALAERQTRPVKAGFNPSILGDDGYIVVYGSDDVRHELDAGALECIFRHAVIEVPADVPSPEELAAVGWENQKPPATRPHGIKWENLSSDIQASIINKMEAARNHLSPWLQPRTEDPRIATIREEVKPIPIADLVEHGTDAPQLLAQRIRRIRELLEG